MLTMRLIDADALKDFYGKWANKHTEFLKPEVDHYIDVQPTIEAEPVRHADWELVEYQCTPFDTDQTLVCTHCGFAHQYDTWYNYCPNCGARMDGESE